jgi:hypothetical protein
MRSDRVLTALAALSMAGIAATPVREERNKQPPPRIPRPKYADEVTDADLKRLTAAIAKRERKAAKRLATAIPE